jgi:hypothetical protein
MAVSKVAKTVARKVIKKKPVKINSNPNKIRAKGERNPTQNKLIIQDINKVLGNKSSSVKSRPIKINSNPMRGKK